MSRTLSLVLGILAFVALCVFCAGRHSRLVVNKLTGSSQAVLSDANYSWASVAFDGRNAMVSGVAPTEEDRAEAISLIGGIAGVRAVTDSIAIGDLVRELRAARRGNVVTLSGKVPSQGTHDTIVQYASVVFASDSLVDNLSIQRGPEDETWTRVVIEGITLLPQLEEGEMRLVNQDVSLLGRVEKPVLRDSLRKSLAELLPESYTSSTEITVPEGLQPLGPAECEAELTSTVKDRRITFASGSTRLTPEASPILEDAVNVALRCSDVLIEVGGYTDSRGDRLQNIQLSQERAQAVVDYLSSRGISRTSLVAKGYGPVNPIATNRTWAGRALNRRIQFTIIR
ncbi:MAG: OmpA family protein [Rhodothermales bacterium]|nr:OmpA family protein [Rhodothermales bacterium]